MANGVALAIKKQGIEDEIVNLFFGDGTFNQGGTLEALNLAGIWKLPTLFVCVNNTYGMSTHISRVTAETDLAKRGPAFGVPSINVDGNDVLAVYEAVKKARKHVLTKGPMLIVENTYRISGHSKSDGNLYRTKEEIEEWKQKCPIKRFAKYLTENGYFTEEELQKIADEAQAEIDAATEFAKASPEPDMATALDSVYVK
jgi:pyruvate dehydrogenase E1 component alpha subunit